MEEDEGKKRKRGPYKSYLTEGSPSKRRKQPRQTRHSRRRKLGCNPGIELHETHQEPNVATIAPRDLRLVCDKSFGGKDGLAHYLRRFGVDVKIVYGASKDPVMEASEKEDRVILAAVDADYPSMDKEDTRIKRLVSTNKKGQAKEIISHFNVHGTYEDVFSRCEMCNSGEYHVVSRDDFKMMWTQANQLDLVAAGSGCGAQPPTINGVEVKALAVTGDKLDKLPNVFVCAHCGYVFWRCSDSRHTKKQFKGIISD